MSNVPPFNWATLSKLIQEELQNSQELSYVPDSAIVIADENQDVIPTFTDYLIRISVPDSGFESKQWRIGQKYKSFFTVAIELWRKVPDKLAPRITEGNPTSLMDFAEAVFRILEHNKFENQLDSYPGSNLSPFRLLSSDDGLTE